jgi:L-ascorbate metabolism protein UlaG (beta-lactamase superfamily)
MKVTLLGHASVLVEMNGATCLMDPVFFDPFEEGAVVSCPERVVYLSGRGLARWGRSQSARCYRS